MKSSLTPLNLAVDSVALFVANLGWVFVVWLPILLVVIFFPLRKTGSSALSLAFFLSFLAALCILIGLFLKWLAQGVVQRKRVRTAVLSFVLACWGILQILSPFLTRQLAVGRFTWSVQGIMFLGAAAVVMLVLTDRAKPFEG
jgi:hypothetical protein